MSRRESVAHPPTPGDEVRGGGAGSGHGVGRQGCVEAREPAAHIGFDLRLGAAGLLEAGDVELLLVARPVGFRKVFSSVRLESILGGWMHSK